MVWILRRPTSSAERNTIMRKPIVFCLAAVAAILAGCVVTSVCPYYTQQDLVFEPAILGNWTSVNTPGEVWRFEQRGELAYRFTLIEPSKATVMEAHVFKLQGQSFLDISSLDRDYHVIPAHYLLRVSQFTPTLRFTELNEMWLKDLLASHPNAVRHHFVQTSDRSEDSRVVLTAETGELQKFLIAHLSSKQAWKMCVELSRDSTVAQTAQPK